MTTLYEHLSLARSKAQMTLKQAAAKTGVSAQHLSRIENGFVPVMKNVAQRLTRCYGDLEIMVLFWKERVVLYQKRLQDAKEELKKARAAAK